MDPGPGTTGGNRQSKYPLAGCPGNLRNPRELNTGRALPGWPARIPTDPCRAPCRQYEASINSVIKQKLIIFLSSLLLACAGGSERPVYGPDAVTPRASDCISQGTVRDYRVLDDRNLVVTAGARQRYHVQLTNRAIGLRSSMRIGFVSNGGRICPGFGSLLVDDGFRPEEIHIYSIRRLTPDEYDAILVRYGRKEPDREHAPAPEDVEGAEVEELD